MSLSILLRYQELALKGKNRPWFQRHLIQHLRSALGHSPEVNALAEEVFARTNRLETLGGGPLFGVKGAAIVGHGSSGANAVADLRPSPGLRPTSPADAGEV